MEIKKLKKNKVVEEVLNMLDSEMTCFLTTKFLDKKLVSVFRDEDLIKSAEAFFENDLNISETSKNMFMHRNTLVYRIEKIYKITSLDIRKFDDAATFLFLKELYYKTSNIR